MVCCKLSSVVEDVYDFSRDIIFLQVGNFFMFEDVLEGSDGIVVSRSVVKRCQRVGEGVWLELEMDFDDVERCDDEFGDLVVRRVGVIKVVLGLLF